MKKVLFIAFMVFNLSQAQKIQWEKSVGGIHADYLMDALPTPDYGFLLAGSSLSGKSGNKKTENLGDTDYFIWKMDEDGNEEWQKSFGGTGSDWLQSIQLTRDAGFILAGISSSDAGGAKKEDSRGGDDFWVLKLDAKGNEEWQKTLGGIGQEKLRSIIQTQDGGYLLGGTSSSGISADKTSPKYGNLDYWIVKLDSKGTLEWQQSYGGQYVDELYSVAQTPDGGYILGGYSNSPASASKQEDSKGAGDYWIVKTDAQGVVAWQRTLGGTGDDHLYAIQPTPDKGYLVGGSSNTQSDTDKTKGNGKGTDIWLVKLDEKGTIQWQETYDIATEDILTSIIDNKDGTYLLSGFTKGERMLSKGAVATSRTPTTETKYKKGTADYVAIKINEKGEVIWDKTVGSNGEDILSKAVLTRDGGYLLCGIGTTPNESAKNSRDKNSGIGSQDFWIVKLKDEQKPEVLKASIEAFPNPTAGFTNVVIGFAFETGTATLVDLAGRQLQQFEISSRTVPVDLSRYPEGIYIINIKANNQNEGIKIIKYEK